MKRKKIIYILITILFIFILILFCIKKQTNKYHIIKISEPTRSVFYAPQYIALELGFFKEENLNIDIVTVCGSDKVMTSVLSGQADIGLLGSEAVMYVANEGKEDYPVLFAKLTQKDGSFLIGRTADSDLSNKTIIAGRKGSMPEMCLEHVLKKRNIFNSVKLLNNIQFDLTSAAFLQGKGDCMTLFEPLASNFEQKGFSILASIGEECETLAYTCYCASKSRIENNSDEIESFTRAIYKSQIWTENHSSEEIVNVLNKYFPDSNSDLLLSSVKRYKKLEVWSKNPIIEKNEYKTIQKIALEAGQINKIIEFEKIYISHFAEKSLKTLGG
ncbi:MAG: ABC transporter substrate-binding protein [Oscillospiraceae bacterium]|nr:ABC transporter substrate-binding protein [Oscillospiraceae bacterium]